MKALNPVREDQLFKCKKTQGYVFPIQPLEIFFEKPKYSSRVDRKKLLLSAQEEENGLQFASEHVSFAPEYWDDVIIS